MTSPHRTRAVTVLASAFLMAAFLTATPLGATAEAQSHSGGPFAHPKRDPRLVAAEVSREGGYATDVFGGIDEPKTKPPRSLSWFRGLAPVLEALVWGALGVLVVVLVLALLRARMPKLTGPAPAAPVRTHRAARAESPPPSIDPWLADGDPEALAAAGEFERAIAALLVRALRALDWGKTQADYALTVREVWRRLPEDHGARPAFGAALAIAERVRFGGRTATRELFDAMHRHTGDVLAHRATHTELRANATAGAGTP
jgi:hypothetical protein